jgi:hypothetical protein
MIRFFRATPPTVHQTGLGLEKAGLISREREVARSIAVLLDRSDLPELNPRDTQPVKTTVTRYSSSSARMLLPSRMVPRRDSAHYGYRRKWAAYSFAIKSSAVI